jgi:1-acyl-sn-glycerol-3-phosphate acyltransferase
MKLRSITNTTKSLITYSLWTILVPPLFLPLIVLALFPRSRRYDSRLYFAIGSTIGWLIVKTTFIKTIITGRHHLPRYPDQPALIIANHASALDIPIIEIVAGSYPHVWMSKAEFSKIPIFGFLLRRMHVLVDTDNNKNARTALVHLYGLLKNSQRHALIFPEGTRYDDGQIHQFYSGFALLAQKLGRPVIPVVISGLHKAFPKKSLVIDSSGAPVKINIGKPIFYTDSTTTEDFVKQVQTYFEQTISTMDA